MQRRELVEIVDTSSPRRRWSKRSQILAVSGLILGVLVLAIAVLRFARSAGLVIGAVESLSEADQIAPDRPSFTGSSVTSQNNAPGAADTPLSQAVSGAAAVSSAAATETNPVPVGPAPAAAPNLLPAAGSGGAGAANQPEAGPFGGTAGAGGNGGSAGTGAGGLGGAAGAGGARPTLWDSVVQSTLALLGQTTISMCGPNTCNTGLVCCNASCGTCVAQGATCDQTQCAGAPRSPTVVRCGAGQCNDGQVCCNASCGICVAPGESCSEQPCP